MSSGNDSNMPTGEVQDTRLTFAHVSNLGDSSVIFTQSLTIHNIPFTELTKIQCV